MSDPRRPQQLLEKHRQGRLSPAEKLELTRASFSDGDLFDALLLDGLVKDCVEDPAFSEEWTATLPPERKWRWRFPVWRVAIAAAMAILAIASIYMVRQPAIGPAPRRDLASARGDHGRSVDHMPVRPKLGVAGDEDQPILLARRLGRSETSRIQFRGAKEEVRLPRQSGTVVQNSDADLMLDLGLIDGLSHGVTLSIFREGKAIGTVRVTSLFREQARARNMGGASILVGDQVRVPVSIQMEGLWARSDILGSSKDFNGARKLAQTALRLGESSDAPLGLRIEAQQRLAETEFRAGDVAAARQRLRETVKTLDASDAPRYSDAWEALGVISLLSGDLTEAKAALTEAERRAALAGDTAAHARALNNLAVLAEMVNDRIRAQQLFEQARQMLLEKPSSADLGPVQRNVDRLGRTK